MRVVTGMMFLACMSLAAGELEGLQQMDPRTRTFISPTRIVRQTTAGGAFSGRCSVKGTETLLARKHGQVPESGWQRGKTACELVNQGNAPFVILDFGRELHGGLSLATSARSCRNARVRIRFGESVAETCSDALSGEHGAGNDHAIRDLELMLPVMGSQEVGNTGFRFVRLDFLTPGTLELESVRAVSLMRPLPRMGSFKSSDDRLNLIWETAVRTVHLCCQDYLWDGIKRDRLVWMGDTHPETMGILAAFGAAKILPDSLDYMAATTAADFWMNTMPTYTLWWIRNLAEWYRFTGDLDYLVRHADYLEKTFDHVAASMSKSGEWKGGNFLDWPTRHNDAAAWAGTQGLALITAREVAFLAQALGRPALEAKARGMARRLAALRPDPQGAKSAAALLALSGLRDPKEMFEQVLSKNEHDGVSTFYGYYMLEAMSLAGEHQRALETVRDYWGAMLDVGATSFWEDFKISWTNNCFRIDEYPIPGKIDVHGDYGEFCYRGFRHSLCHGWSCGPAAWCQAHILGVQPVGVGGKSVEIHPFLGDLSWAEGDVPLATGVLHVRHERAIDGSIQTIFTAPPDVQVSVLSI